MTRPAKVSTVTPIAAALEIDDLNAIEWSDNADVVVVGWGAAGACAAIEARATGASVLVIDRFAGGGASTLSGGVVYAGGGTPYQKQAGFKDTPEAMADYLRHEVNGVVSDATLKKFCDESVANLAWLEMHGARFGATMPDYKTSYPPEGKFLYYSGNEVVPAYKGDKGGPAPRGHRAVAKGQSGATLYAALQAATLRAGVRPLTQAAVRRLVRLNGAIIGVEVWQLPPGDPATLKHAQLNRDVERWRTFRPGKSAACRREAANIEQEKAQPRFIRARHGVVLSTGGFMYNPEMIKEHAPHTRRGWPIGGAGCDGSAVRLGATVGAVSKELNNVSAWRFITPPVVWPKGVVINSQGERFANEQLYGAALGYELVDRQGGKGWLIIDGKLRSQAMRQCMFGRIWAFQSLPALAMMMFSAKKATTPEALAARIQADPAKLRASIDGASAAARGECEDAFGKSPDMRHDLSCGPYYAIDISIGAATFPLAVLTLGGLVVNEENGQVIDGAGQAIAGLFAAGRAAVGLPSSRYISGLSLADCVFSGRRAGRAAAHSTDE